MECLDTTPVNNPHLEELFYGFLGWLVGAEGSSREPLLKLLSDGTRVTTIVTADGKHRDAAISECYSVKGFSRKRRRSRPHG